MFIRQIVCASPYKERNIIHCLFKSFTLSPIDLCHQGPVVRHTINEVLSWYFIIAMQEQKIEINSKHIKCLQLVSIG